MKVLKRLIPYAVIVAAALLLLYSPDIAPDRYTDLATFFRVEMKRQGYSGFSVAAVSDGSVLYVDGFGVDGSGRAIGADTPLFAPAAAKSMAALAAYSLVRDGSLSLDRPVRDYLPWFSLAGGRGEPSIRNLITHTTGLSDASFDDSHAAAGDLEAAVHSMVGAIPISRPGSSFHYIDTDYQALALAMEKAAGKPYAAILADRIFRPLGMKTSSARGSDPLPRGATSFFAIAMPRAAPRSAFGAPSGYVISTASDMGQYMAFLLGPEKFKRGPLPARLVPALFQPLLSGCPYGYGLFLGQSDGGRFAYHDGALDGFSSRIALLPDKRTGIAILAAQVSLLQSLVSLPALTDGARRIVLEGSAARPFPLGRLYILLAVAACVQLLALALQTGGALRWAKEVRDKTEAKGTRGPTRFAAFRSWAGIAIRAAIALGFPALIGLAFGRQVDWNILFELEPGLAVWCLSLCMFGILRNAARLVWLRGPSAFRRPR
jgi:CubicO group peptidase (beta-lactamase class C family)